MLGRKLRQDPVWQAKRRAYYEKNRERILAHGKKKRAEQKMHDQIQAQWARYMGRQEKRERVQQYRREQEVIVKKEEEERE